MSKDDYITNASGVLLGRINAIESENEALKRQLATAQKVDEQQTDDHVKQVSEINSLRTALLQAKAELMSIHFHYGDQENAKAHSAALRMIADIEAGRPISAEPSADAALREEIDRLKDLINRNWSGAYWRAVNYQQAKEVNDMLASAIPSSTGDMVRAWNELNAKLNARYEARGNVVHKLPVKVPTEGGTSIEIGFPVCTASEYVDAATLAAILDKSERTELAPTNQVISESDSTLFKEATPSGGVIRLAKWPEGYVLWFHGEIVWRTWFVAAPLFAEEVKDACNV